jgi:N-acetylmuramoyl-L-alanine amidase
MNNKQAIILHHTGTFQDQSDTTWQAVARYHKEKWGIDTFGYNYFIEYPNGKIIKGRNCKTERGYHCSADNMNEKSIGICLEGNFENEYPSDKQLASLTSLLEDFREKYSIPIKNILGHQEVKEAATLCPGKNLMRWILLYRSKYVLVALIEAIKQQIQKLRG